MIAEKGEIHSILEDNYIVIEEKLKEQLGGLTVNVDNAQFKYVNDKENRINLETEYNDQNYACMVEKFHGNHDFLAKSRDDLNTYGIQIQWEQLEIQESIDHIMPTKEEDFDCRYKQKQECQGDMLRHLTDAERHACRVPVDAQCFDETYESFWALDFWSFLSWVPAIALCVFENDFDYDVCVANSAYIVNLKYLQDEMGIHW